MRNKNVPRTIPGLIVAINKATETTEIINLENYMSSYFAIPLVFGGAIMNFILFRLVYHHALITVLADSAVLLVIATLFAVTQYLSCRERLISHINSFLYSFVLLFLTYRYYGFMGPSILTLSFIVIMFALVKIERLMLTYVGITMVFIGLYISFILSKTPYEFKIHYYILQTIFFTLMFFFSLLLHTVNVDRYKRIQNQYLSELHQREEIETLYEEVTATEEELREQYDMLAKNTRMLRENEEVLYQLAHYDSLTALPNRKLLMDTLEQLVVRFTKTGKTFQVVFIDLDNFKKINDTLGHNLGDQYISLAANRLAKSAHASDFLGRIGGDEFALIIERQLDVEQTYSYVEEIRKDFQIPFHINATELRSSASFGIAIFPKDGTDVVSLMKNADMAMYKAKEFGKNNIQQYRSSMNDELVEKTDLENKLVKALQNEEFFLVFQPIYNVKTNKIRGFEALIRWNSPELGIVSPNRFIQLSEEIGLIIPLGEWILRSACQTLKALQKEYKLDAVISVNVSTVQIEDFDFLSTTQRIISETGLSAKQLEIEITESIFINSFHHTSNLLDSLKKMDISISLDDFGTGYSSLSYLKMLPIDILKIDKSFIDDLVTPESKKMIVGDIIGLAHNLGISVIAEGIEKALQFDYLKLNECDFIQGFFMDKPMDLEALKQLIEASPGNFSFLE